jgi:hypothetical protein
VHRLCAAGDGTKPRNTAIDSGCHKGSHASRRFNAGGQMDLSQLRQHDRLGGRRQGQELSIIFGEGVYAFEPPSGTALTGTLDMGGGYVLDLKGTVTQTAPLSVAISGYGRAGTPAAGWEYDYNAALAYQWPNGVNQMPALVGSVIRAKPHDGGAAGFVASFIAVKQP